MTVEHEAVRNQLRAYLALVNGLDLPSRRARHGAEVIEARTASPASPAVSDPPISDAQALMLQALVRDVNVTHKAPFQTVWTLVNQHTGVSGYRHTPASRFDAAAFYLQHWIDTGLPPA